MDKSRVKTEGKVADETSGSRYRSYFTEERFLAEAVESVLRQTYEEGELILVDDGAVDNSTLIAKPCADKNPIYYGIPPILIKKFLIFSWKEFPPLRLGLLPLIRLREGRCGRL